MTGRRKTRGNESGMVKETGEETYTLMNVWTWDRRKKGKKE